MKKILSLLSLLMLCIVGMNAQTTIYSWESPEGTPIETGGTIAYVKGDGDRLNYLNSGNYTICLNGKKANVNDEVASANAGRMVITLDQELQTGDEIAITAYITKNSSAKSSAYIIFETGTTTESAIFSDEANIHEDFGGSPKTVTVTVPEEAAGSKTITMTRGQTGTNLFITKLVITGERSSGETYTIGGNVNGPGVNMDLTLAESATLPYTATFADCYGSEPPAMIQIQNAVVTSGTNVTLGTLNGWDTTFTISEEGTSVISLTLNIGAMTITVNVTKNGSEEEPVAETKTITLVPGPWDVDGARYAAYVWNEGGNQWIDFAKSGDNYAVAIPADMTGLILARMNGETTENNFNEGVCWNKTGDINFTEIADQTVFVITDWAAYQTYTPAEYALVYAKAQLQEAINKVKAFGLDGLADVIAAAEAAVGAEDATVQSLQTAAAAFQDGVKTYVMGVLTTLKQYMSTFSGAAAEALKEDFEKLEADINNNDIDAVKTDITSLMAKGSPYLQADIVKLEGYAAVLNNEAITADVAAMKAAVEGGSFAGLLAAVEKFKTDFLAAAPDFVQQIKFAAAGYKDAGKTNAMDQLEAAIAAAEQALGAEDATIVTVGLAVRNLILALQTYVEANNTYTIAGTKELTGTEEDWQIVEANNMTLVDGLYTWTAENITVSAENQPMFKVVITNIDGNNTWVPASEEGNDHNWVITPEVVGGEGVFNITITFNAETQEINVTGEKVEVVEEDPVKEAPTGWTLAITNGNLASDDVSSYAAKVYPSDAVVGATIVAGAGKNGSRGIVVNTADETGVDGATDWDSQFWIVLNDELPIDTKLHVEFDYKASQAATAYTQAHANPGNYHHYIAIGDVNFTTEWQHFSADIVVDAAMAKGEGGDGNGTGMKSIAFNLAVNRNAVDYCFDNFGVWYQAPKEITEWADLIVNGDMEGDNAECFYVTEQGVGGPYLAEFTEGIGVDGSKAIKVQSIDDETVGDHEAQDWDTQFFVRLPYQIPAGTKYRVSFDYKADKAGGFDTQAHTEPGGYIHWACVGSGNFTTAWQTYSAEGTISADMSKTGQVMQTIAFNLAKNRKATEFIFDNVKFEVDADIVAELTKNPAANPTQYPHGIIADGTYYVMNANDGTLINAEGALDAKGAPITFTFDKYSKAFTIEGADYFTGKQWTIANAIEGMSGYYTISTAEGFLAANATALEQIADGTADAAVWILLEKAYWEDIVNSTYTVAGTANLTGFDWDIVEANQMTYNDETQLYEKTFKRIAIDAENQPEFKVVQTNMEGEQTWYPEGGSETNWVITTDYVGGEGLYDITITFDPSDFKEVGVIAEKRIVFPENAIVYDFEAAADAGENPANKNGSAGNGQAFYGWENPEKTDSKRQDYKGYEWAEGSLLPEVCHVWRRSDRINGNVADNGGLKCPSNKEMAIDGLDVGDKVIIVYDAENATDKEIIWAIGDGTAEGGPGHVRATATINGVEAVTGETTIASGAEILVNSVTPADNGTGYIVFQVKKGMIIKQIAVIPAQRYSATFTTNAGWEKAYAYAWSGEGESAVKFLGDWPGTEMTPGNGGNDWKISFIAEEAPEMIIFSNGVDAQTADLDFEDGKAYEYNIPVIPGTYYLYNVAADGYVVGANKWGTRASISKLGGISMNVVMNNGKYELKTDPTYPGKRLGLDGYVDNGSGNQNWTIAEVEGQEGVVTLSTDGTKVLFWDGGEATSTSIGDMPATAENAYWKFVTEEERMALFADATAENPADATFLIINPDFSRNANKAVWTGDDFSVGGGNDVSNNAEKWGGNSQTFNIKQQVTLPDGIYRVVWNGFYRYNNTTENTNNVAAAAHEAGTEVINSFVYLNETDYPLTSIADEAAVAAFGGMPFSQAQASAAFGQGLYEQSAEVTVIGGTLTIGIKKIEHPGCDWTIWDNFRLFYLTSEIPADSYKPAYEEALAAAQAALVNALYANVTGEEKAALEQAIADNTTVEDNADAYKAAIQALETATNAFTGAKGAYDGLADAKALVAGLSYQYATAAKKSAAESAAEAVATNADDATAKTTALYKAFRQYAESSAILEGVETATDFTSYIVNPKAEQAIAEPWSVVKGEGSGGSLTILDGEPWTDGEDNSTHKYFDGGNWGASSWDVSQKQTIKLPKGKYQLTVKSRASGDMTSFVVFAGEDKTEMQHIGNTGGLFNGGWNDASVEFEMTEAGDITIGVQGVTESQHQWMSFSDFRLYSFDEYVPVYTVAGGVGTDEGGVEDAVFTTSWDASLEANNLDKGEDGIYTISYSDVPLAPGSTILYKVVADHNWDYLSWGFNGDNANYVVNLPEGKSLPEGMEKGYFDITFKFNPAATFENGFNVDCIVEYDEAKTEDIATGISSIVAEAVNNGNAYNLNGQKVQKARKGLYIINGKKQVVK